VNCKSLSFLLVFLLLPLTVAPGLRAQDSPPVQEPQFDVPPSSDLDVLRQLLGVQNAPAGGEPKDTQAAHDAAQAEAERVATEDVERKAAAAKAAANAAARAAAKNAKTQKDTRDRAEREAAAAKLRAEADAKTRAAAQQAARQKADREAAVARAAAEAQKRAEAQKKAEIQKQAEAAKAAKAAEAQKAVERAAAKAKADAKAKAISAKAARDKAAAAAKANAAAEAQAKAAAEKAAKEVTASKARAEAELKAKAAAEKAAKAATANAKADAEAKATAAAQEASKKKAEATAAEAAKAQAAAQVRAAAAQKAKTAAATKQKAEAKKKAEAQATRATAAAKAKAESEAATKAAAEAEAEAVAAESVVDADFDEGEATFPVPSAFSISATNLPEPGTVLTVDNFTQWRGVLSPTLEWLLRNGAHFAVSEFKTVHMEPERVAATERYHDQVTLSADKTQLENYVAGIPFPFVTTRDPDAATKIMFNTGARVIQDDLDGTHFGCQTGFIDPKTGLKVERDYTIGHFRRLYFTSRFYHEPKPLWETTDGMAHREALRPILEPFDLKGAGFTYTRFLDSKRQDDSWLYLPQIRRVRRLSTAQRSEGIFGQDIDLDSYGGFSGNPAWMSWKLLGKKTVLGTMNAQNHPAKWQAPPADFMYEDGWEPREVYVIEGRSLIPGYAFSARVIYVDIQSYIIPFSEMYDKEGALAKGLMQLWSFVPGNDYDGKPAMDFPVPTLLGITMFDMRDNHATRCQLPRENSRGLGGWYYHMGATTNDDFDVSSFIGEGR
jgi:hypothetical protein